MITDQLNDFDISSLWDSQVRLDVGYQYSVPMGLSSEAGCRLPIFRPYGTLLIYLISFADISGLTRSTRDLCAYFAPPRLRGEKLVFWYSLNYFCHIDPFTSTD